MIFLGSPKYIRHTLDLPVRQDFEISHALVCRACIRKGRAELQRAEVVRSRTTLEERHALISRLLGLHGSSEMLILAGSLTEATRAAAECVTRTAYVTPFVRLVPEHGG